jgi:putative hydrolase of the HAD superfamily
MIMRPKQSRKTVTYRAILFDFGGTLDFPRHWLDRFVKHYLAAGINLTRGQFAPAFDTATRKAYGDYPLLNQFGLSDLVGYLVGEQLRNLPELRSAACGIDSGHLSQTTAAIRNSFVAESAHGFAVSRPLIAHLSGRFKIGVVSNFYGNLASVLKEAGMADSVQVIADSSRLTLWKPDPAIFVEALAELGVQADETLMVGDSIGKDCVPARALGMTTVWLRHQEFIETRMEASDGVNFTIDSLEELYGIKWLK